MAKGKKTSRKVALKKSSSKRPGADDKPKIVSSKTQRNKKPAAFSNGFPIVGIGASAGGLEAIKELLQALPTDTGMAFVFVQHLDPTHESLRATHRRHEQRDGDERSDAEHVGHVQRRRGQKTETAGKAGLLGDRLPQVAICRDIL